MAGHIGDKRLEPSHPRQIHFESHRVVLARMVLGSVLNARERHFASNPKARHLRATGAVKFAWFPAHGASRDVEILAQRRIRRLLPFDSRLHIAEAFRGPIDALSET